MALHPDFPTDPYAILDPNIRWYPGDEQLAEVGYELLLPPLVHKVRQGVKAWRDAGYAGACPTTRALLNHWFRTEHLVPQEDGTVRPFRWYFAQQEAVESAIWLYEIEGARDPYALMRYDSSGRVSAGMFPEDWPRYVMKLATGAGKTKVMGLLIAWCYFHRRYEENSDLSANFLLIAPNIIVLDRLRLDFDGLRVFHEDPVLPPNGWEGQNWQDDFQMTVHVQDQIGHVAEGGNLFLSNIHRVFQSDSDPSIEDANTLDYFLGRRPSGKTTDSQVDLGFVVRQVPDLVVLNDEAHHIHDPRMAWFKNIEDISNQLRLKGSKLSVQFDLTATPKHNNGAIFVQTIVDYPLVEAIRQRVVKTPVLPDEASRSKLHEHRSARFTEQYEDYLHLGYLEWKKVYQELLPRKKSIMFVMTDDTRHCDDVKDYLLDRYPDLRDAVLVIHTKNNGEISEAATGKSKEELDRLREESRKIDSFDDPNKAIVSVMMLREGWDVQNVVTIVGLRAYGVKSGILPEQTLGRGLRRMFRGEDVPEKVSVVGTAAFMEFVESIKAAEGVDFEYAEMGERTPPKSPLVVEVDQNKERGEIERLDIALPVLTPRIYREYKNLNDLDVTALPHKRVALRHFSEEEQREIQFRDIDSGLPSHVTVLDSLFEPDYQSVVAYFANSIRRDLHLAGGFDVLFGKIKAFIERELFDQDVALDDANVLRNLSEPEATRTLIETLKSGINALTIQDTGTTELRHHIKLSETRPFLVKDQRFIVAKRSVFNKIVGDNDFELEFIAFLDGCSDIVSFAKNSQSTRFRIEYRNVDGSIANYYPDFLVNQNHIDIWIIETKGREDVEDAAKWDRLVQWCADATAIDERRDFHPLFVSQDLWKRHRPTSFASLVALYTD